MSYVSSTIGRVLDQINRSYFLPAIQRPYVWQPEQIVALFDSLSRGYPISSFCSGRSDRSGEPTGEIYKFVENFRHGDTHNEMAEPDGRDVVLVLDGQQRLTSLLIGLRGTYAVRAKYGRRTIPTLGAASAFISTCLRTQRATTRRATTKTLASTYGLRFFEGEPKEVRNTSG